MPNFIYHPPTHPTEILFDDKEIIIVNKPSGLLSVPGRLPEHQDNLIGRMQESFGKLHCVHRLDMDTSGIMILARNKKALSHLSKQFQNRSIKKVYQAIVWGVPEPATGEINLPLITDWPNRPRQKICHDTGKSSQTKYRLLKQIQGKGYLAIYPVTGRSHQIRIHLQAIGHPILGCRFYAHQNALNAADRLCLHASEINFEHPIHMKKIKINCAASFWFNEVEDN